MEFLTTNFKHDKGEQAYIHFEQAVIGRGVHSSRGASSRKPEGYSMLVRYFVSKDVEGKEVLYRGERLESFDPASTIPLSAKIDNSLISLRPAVEHISQKRQELKELRAQRQSEIDKNKEATHAQRRPDEQ
jgi:hypothetical protein